MRDQSTDDVLQKLCDALGADAVQRSRQARMQASWDGLRRGRAALSGHGDAVLPLAVVLPRSTAEVVATLRIAAVAGVGVVAYGGGTGLMGGALTVTPALVLDLRRMDRVIEIVAADRTARVQSGVVIGRLNDALAPHGLICGHDPWTVPIATVGGAISTNGLGYLAARYGSIGDQALGLEVVLADGSVVRTRPAERSSTGPHLKRLWVGAEGTLGVITEATLRVFPIPEERRLRAVQFIDFATGYGAICAMAAIGLRPAMIDYGAPPDGGAEDEARLTLAFEGFREEVAAADARALAICREHSGLLLDDATARAFWDARHVEPVRLRSWRASEGRAPQPGTPGSSVFEYLHVALPQSQVLPFLRTATVRAATSGANVTEWGLWNSPELVSLVVQQRTDTPERLAALRETLDDVLRLAQDLGGSMEYVHGVGVRLAHLMEREHGAGLAVLQRLKGALDPAGSLNPGKLGVELPHEGYSS